jgi:hypothetical protein
MIAEKKVDFILYIILCFFLLSSSEKKEKSSFLTEIKFCNNNNYCSISPRADFLQRKKLGFFLVFII